MAFCSQCGAGVQQEARFCPRCGAPIQAAVAVQQAPQWTPPSAPTYMPPPPVQPPAFAPQMPMPAAAAQGEAPAPKALIADSVSVPLEVPVLGRIDLLHHVLPAAILWLALLLFSPIPSRYHFYTSSVFTTSLVQSLVWIAAGLVCLALVRARDGARIAAGATLVAAVLLVMLFRVVIGFRYFGIEGRVLSAFILAAVLAAWLLIERRPLWTLIAPAPLLVVVYLVTSVSFAYRHATLVTNASLVLVSAIAIGFAALLPERPAPTPSTAPTGFAPMHGQLQPNGYPMMPAAMGLPTVTSTVLITLFFGLFGLIPASSNANRATQMGVSGAPYWKAFWITWGSQWAVFILLMLVLFGASQ